MKNDIVGFPTSSTYRVWTTRGDSSDLGMVIVVDADKLAAVLSDFARTLTTDFPVQGILNHLVQRIVDVLPVTAAGVTLISAGKAPHYIAASDESALRFERLQAELGEGPCVSAHEFGEAVAVADLACESRFPRFASAALASGLVAVFTFPLRNGDGGLGALDLYRDVAGDLDADDMAAAQTLADVAAAYLLNAQARDDARATSDRFRVSALHDSLTGLPNRLLLRERLGHAAQRARRSRAGTAILFADLDRFKRVNDTYGHHVGDELLLAVAQRLAALIRPGDTLARVSGDEFVFLCEDLQSAADAEILARRVDEAFARPFELATSEIALTASVGMAFASAGQDISGDLVVEADIAMYQAKRKGGAGHQIVDLREALQSSDRNSLERDLRAAFVDDKLDLAYQPIVRGADGVITGVEALLRWTDPNRGTVSPRSFVDVAERSSLIGEIGAWVLERSCRDRGRWMQKYPARPLDLAVNVSASHLLSPDYCATVAKIIAATGMDPTALVLEITENVLIDDVDRAAEVLVELKKLGIRIALDDFGTGYSSLSYLRRLPIDIVKIDQGFIADIGHGASAAALVAAVANLAHVLAFSVTAEGVETQEQHDVISAIGCECAQGFFYAQPMTAAAIGDRLGQRSAHTAFAGTLGNLGAR